LASKLGISDADWREIQALIKLEKDEGNQPYELVSLERNHLGSIGAWMARPQPRRNRPHGPVFFLCQGQRALVSFRGHVGVGQPMKSPNQAASGNGATALVFHAERLGRAVPEQRCWATLWTKANENEIL